MSGIGAGEEIYNLKKRIQELSKELKSLGSEPPQMSELIDSANILRQNEFYSKAFHNQNELIKIYEKYAKSLEAMLSTVFDIQNDLKNILKEQSKMLSMEDTPRKSRRSKK